jgi:predicted phosphatase
MALSYAFASSMKAAIPMAVLRHAEICQHLVIERDCLLTNVTIRGSDIIILDDREVHIPEHAFRLDDVLV